MAKRAMTKEHASRVKTGGHENEKHFAKIIGGRVQAGTHTDKKDVIDRQDRAHSVKSGKWWQVFLYSEERLRTNTIFQGIGKAADIMLACLAAYPPKFEDYQKSKKNKQITKQALRPHMRRLKKELEKKRIFKAMLDKSLFDGGKADYLSIYPGPSNTPPRRKHFHIFHKDDVTAILLNDLEVANSRAIKPGDTAEQKVVFKSLMHNKRQIGEIEVRHDSHAHYREMKFRFNGEMVLNILQVRYKAKVKGKDTIKGKKVRPRATTYGRASRLFK